MAAIIKLRQQGSKNAKTYRLVVADKKTPRDGKYIEKLGWYNPTLKDDKNLFIHTERVMHWLNHGAQITDKAMALVKRYAPQMIQEFMEKKRKANAPAKTAEKKEPTKKAEPAKKKTTAKTKTTKKAKTAAK
jgi:small subunit ribosomal protein S16